MNYGNKAIAGPGHNPPIPQPIPNIISPITSLESNIIVGEATLNLGRRTGLLKSLNVIKLNPTATSITNIREAILL